jgi:8-amino-7-oxononanoate synthase
MPEPFDWLADSLAELRQRGLLRVLAERDGPQRGDCIAVSGQDLVNFGSNDYLGLADDPRVIEAASDALRTSGFGAGASPLVTGRGHWHAQLERRLAEFEHAQAALLFPSGYAANVGTIAALVGPGDVIYSDAKNHASIIDGCRLSGAGVVVYRHGDVDHLADLLQTKSGATRRQLIVTDGLFSMDGDLAPLIEIAELADRHGAMLLVDEAHATGVLGEQGRGACELAGIDGPNVVRVGTLSKALGSIGGFVVGSQLLVDWLANRARPYVFSTATPEAAAAAALAAFEIVATEPERRTLLLARAAELRERLKGAGMNVGRSQSQIIPIMLGDPTVAVRASAALRERGLFVPAIRPPSVPEGESLLRLSLTWRHDEAMLNRVANELVSVLKQVAA